MSNTHTILEPTGNYIHVQFSYSNESSILIPDGAVDPAENVDVIVLAVGPLEIQLAQGDKVVLREKPNLMPIDRVEVKPGLFRIGTALIDSGSIMAVIK